MKGVDLLNEGIIWRIGNGSTVNIWKDPWIPNKISRKPVTPRGASLLTKVSELINLISGEWDEQLVSDLFWHQDAELILGIPINENENDWPAWHYDSKGTFSVKSAYKLPVQKRDYLLGRDSSTSSSDFTTSQGFRWSKIWQSKIPNKVKMFLWCFAHNSLPVRRNIAR